MKCLRLRRLKRERRRRQEARATRWQCRRAWALYDMLPAGPTKRIAAYVLCRCSHTAVAYRTIADAIAPLAAAETPGMSEWEDDE